MGYTRRTGWNSVATTKRSIELVCFARNNVTGSSIEHAFGTCSHILLANALDFVLELNSRDHDTIRCKRSIIFVPCKATSSGRCWCAGAGAFWGNWKSRKRETETGTGNGNGKQKRDVALGGWATGKAGNGKRKREREREAGTGKDHRWCAKRHRYDVGRLKTH